MAIILALILFSGAYLESEMEDLTSKVVRLRVVPNSNSEEDQALKLKVRDEVLSYAGALTEQAENSAEAEELLGDALDNIQKKAETVIAAEGYDYEVKLFLESEVFPTRQYDDFSLPAGEYRSLRIEIGEAEGDNWWCVVFPPLCTASAMGTVEETAEAGGFSEDQVGLISGDDDGVVLKFKCLELFSKVKSFFSW